MERDNNGNLISRLADLLSETASAHAKYEEEALGGKRDDAWPLWYALYMREHGLAALLEHKAGQDSVMADLQGLLSQADQSYNASEQTEDWPTFYARYLLERAN